MKAMTRISDRTLTDTTKGTPLPPVSAAFAALAKRVRSWQDRRQTRAALRRLDTHMIRDIGLDAREAQAEAAKPFWQD
ncbi:MAG: DUF1127 domain-containing protein [Gemmobacter sp.]